LVQNQQRKTATNISSRTGKPSHKSWTHCGSGTRSLAINAGV